MQHSTRRSWWIATTAMLLALFATAVAAFPPEGLVEIGGACMPPHGNGTESCGRAILLLGKSIDDADADGRPRYTRIAAVEEDRNGSGRGASAWSVTDQIELSPPADGFHVQLGTCGLREKCNVDECEIDNRIIAVAREFPEQEVWTNIASAWQLDLDTGRFETLPPTRVGCSNVGMDF